MEILVVLIINDIGLLILQFQRIVIMKIGTPLCFISFFLIFFLVFKRKSDPSFTKENIFMIKMNYIDVLSDLGKILRLRQQVTCTAMVFFWRFYLKNSFCSYKVGREKPVTPDFIAPSCLVWKSRS